MEGIVAGVRARGGKLDTWDLVAMNAWLEMSYYVGWHNQRNKIPNPPGVTAPEHCSAFVATGSYPRDGKVVIGHNAWTGYVDGQRWNIIFDIVPANGHRILMDGFPGLIHSADDFGINLSRRIRKGVEFNLALDNLADRFYYEIARTRPALPHSRHTRLSTHRHGGTDVPAVWKVSTGRFSPLRTQ